MRMSMSYGPPTWSRLDIEAEAASADLDELAMVRAVQDGGYLHVWGGGFEAFVGEDWYPAEDRTLRKCVARS
jgi:hypothetical protein